MRKTVILARNAYGYGGAEKAELTLARALKAAGYRPIVVTNVAILQNLCQEEGIEVKSVTWIEDGSGRKRFFVKQMVRGTRVAAEYLWLCLRERPLSVLLDSKDDQMFGTLPARLCGAQVYWRDHGGMSRDWIGRGFSGFDTVYFAAMRMTRRIITVSTFNADLLRTLVPQVLHARITPCYLGIPTEGIKCTRPPEVPARRVGLVSRLVADKGVFTLIEAGSRLKDAHPGLEYHMTGDGEDIDAAKEASSRLGLPVTFHPFTSDLKAALNALDLFVLPTKAESLGLAIIEAMAAGRITIASRVGGVPEIIDDGENGFLCEPTPEGVALAIERALRLTPSQVAAMTSNAREKVARVFDERQNTLKMIELITR